MKKLGLIVNPVAGMGGAVGLKGTDGPELLVRARELGAVPLAENRAQSALSALARLGDRLEVFTFRGSMGETAALLSGITPRVIGAASQIPSTSADTKEAARQLEDLGVELLLFAGGDGTTRDIHDVVGTSLTVLGIPAGVKIQSAVFATSPVVAGQVAESYLSGRVGREKEAEVMDINEEDYRREILSTRLHGYLKIPDCSSQLQSRKSASAPSERAIQQAIAAELIERMVDDRFFIVGPGTTCRPIMEELGLQNSLLGVDIVCAGQLVGQDLGEREILQIIGDAPCTLVLTPVGGQGFLLGRGNQQISPKVIQKVGKENIAVCATSEKLSALRGRPLLVDTGDPDCDAYLCGYYRVVTGYREATIYKVSDRA
jgi:predicted polyphosphate/ATP-dependent NAD kinase